MALQDVLNRARAQKKEIPVLGEVQVRRLSAGEMLEIGEKTRPGLHLVLTAVQTDAGKPMFESIAQIQACDWDVVSALIDACNEVNKLPKSVPNS